MSTVVLAKDGKSLVGLSSCLLPTLLLLLLAEGCEGLVSLQACSKSGERSCSASHWVGTLPVTYNNNFSDL